MATSFETLRAKSIAGSSQGAFESLKKKEITRVAPTEKPERSIFGKVAGFLAPSLTRTVEKAFDPNEDVTARDVIGSGLEIASYALPVGAAAKGATLAARGLGLVAKPAAKAVATTLGRQALKYGLGGAVSGGLFQAGGAIGEGARAGEVAKRAATGAAVGGAVGAAIPVAGRIIGKTYRGAKGLISKPAERKAEQIALLKARTPDARVAAKTLTESGKLATDPVAKEVIRQGIPEADVALMKVSSKADKVKMSKMLDIRQSQLTNKRITERATDVVGDTFVEKVAKPIQNLNKTAAKNLDTVAQRLSGSKIDVSDAINHLGNELNKAGVKSYSSGRLKFSGSDFEGLRPIQSAISNVYNRALKVAKTGDALQAHRLKRYIDNIVEYGAEGEGLRGNAERMLKGFRRAVDQILDQKFPAYNRANTVFAETIGELNKLGVVLGKRFRLGDQFADAQAGLGLRRVLSNTQSRAEILRLLDGMQALAKKYGIPIDEDVITQANFADVLEKMLGSEAPTSFLGQISRGAETFGSTGGIGGLEQIGSTGSEFARGNIVRGTIKAGAHLVEVTRGINQENRLKALRALLGEVEKKATVFGKPK